MDNEQNLMAMGSLVSEENLREFRLVLEGADLNITQARRPRPLLPWPKPPTQPQEGEQN